MRYLTTWLPELAAALTFGALWLWSRQGDVPVALALLASALGGVGIWIAGRYALRIVRQGKSVPMSKSSVILVVVLLSTTGLVLRLQPESGQSITAGVFLWAGLACGLAFATFASPKG